ncbi:MAG: hypothetical protein EXS32_00220 [Opitutus sp.]|nr:hypothetical protein [Opitutus sp.]
MGFFDRLAGKKLTPPATPAATPQAEVAAATAAAGGVLPRLTLAREKLDAKDLPAALSIYEEVLAASGDRADVLVTISGDLGSSGHVGEIIELIAPRYDADLHGPATGLNLLQAYLATRNADAAQHVLDILFGLNRPELEERLHGFSNAIAELIHDRHSPLDPGATSNIPVVPKIGLITISKPIWFYGLEPLAAQLLPPKEGRLRRIAFVQLALPGYAEISAAMQKPEDELGRLTRGLPLWLAETFYFSAAYAPVAAVGIMKRPGGDDHYALFASEWTTENLQQLIDANEGGFDYIVTGALRAMAGDYEVLLRLWEVKKFRERKTFSARWTPATADAALAQLQGEVRAFMEWSPASAALAYSPPVQPSTWLGTLGASLSLFLAEKTILPKTQLAAPAESLAHAAHRAATSEMAALAFLTMNARAAKLIDSPAPVGVALAASPLVTQARQALGL